MSYSLNIAIAKNCSLTAHRQVNTAKASKLTVIVVVMDTELLYGGEK